MHGLRHCKSQPRQLTSMESPPSPQTITANAGNDTQQHSAGASVSQSSATARQPSGQAEISHVHTNENTAFKTPQQALKALKMNHFTNTKCKLALKLLNVLGAHNAKHATKLWILSVKMVQRSIPTTDLVQLLSTSSDQSNRDFANILNLPSTTVRIHKLSKNNEEVLWLRGDVPVFDDDKVVIGQPTPDVQQRQILTPEERQPTFESVEYCRLLHVLADSRMASTRQKLAECMDRKELDQEQEDPWTEHIAPLFNDGQFKPVAISVLAGGVTLSDISSLNPARRPHIRDAGTLKRKYGAFKSEFGTALTRYEASGQGDPDAFAEYANGRSYIMYAFCFLKVYPVLQPLATRALASDARREEGVGAPLRGYGFGGRETLQPRTKRQKVSEMESSHSGVDSLITALKPHDPEVAKEFEEAERDKMRFEAYEADARFTKATVEAIAALRAQMERTEEDEERSVLENSLRRLLAKLGNK